MARKYSRTEPPQPRSFMLPSSSRRSRREDDLSQVRRRSGRLLVVAALLLAGVLLLSRNMPSRQAPPADSRPADALIGEKPPGEAGAVLGMTLYFDDGSSRSHHQSVTGEQAERLRPEDWVRVDFAPGAGERPPRITRFYFETISNEQ
jgi:hypothetical protein